MCPSDFRPRKSCLVIFRNCKRLPRSQLIGSLSSPSKTKLLSDHSHENGHSKPWKEHSVRLVNACYFLQCTTAHFPCWNPMSSPMELARGARHPCPSFTFVLKRKLAKPNWPCSSLGFRVEPSCPVSSMRTSVLLNHILLHQSFVEYRRSICASTILADITEGASLSL